MCNRQGMDRPDGRRPERYSRLERQKRSCGSPVSSFRVVSQRHGQGWKAEEKNHQSGIGHSSLALYRLVPAGVRALRRRWVLGKGRVQEAKED